MAAKVPSPNRRESPGKKGCNYKASFTEYNKEENEIGPTAKELNDGSEMPVKVNKKICKIDNQFHFLYLKTMIAMRKISV